MYCRSLSSDTSPQDLISTGILSDYPIGIAFRCGYVEVPEEYSLEIGRWRAASSLSEEYTATEIFKRRIFIVVTKMLILFSKICPYGGPIL
jgi:hypothetical protein